MRLKFENAGYYFPALVALAIGGFWSSYFSKFFDGTTDFSFYFHFHVVMVSLWIAALIVQPILIKSKRNELHKFIGKVSYFIFPLLFISVILLVHSRSSLDELDLVGIFIPFKDLLILAVAFFIAIKYRNNMEIHARGMICTGIVFIEPALIRLLNSVFVGLNNPYLWTLFLIYSLVIGLIILERNQKNGRWVFPLILTLLIMVHSVLLFNIPLPGLESFSKWFLSLPLT